MLEPDVGSSGRCRGSKERLGFGQQGRKKGKRHGKVLGGREGRGAWPVLVNFSHPKESHLPQSNPLKNGQKKNKSTI